MKSLVFLVEGTPIAQPRHRSTRNGRHYIPKEHKVHAWKDAIRQDSAGARPAKPFRGPLELTLEFVLPAPKMLGPVDDAGLPPPCDRKPDIDNLTKAVMDAMNDQGFWIDDAQVATLIVSKRYAQSAENPHCLVSVRPLTLTDKIKRFLRIAD